jgi:methyltransferase
LRRRWFEQSSPALVIVGWLLEIFLVVAIPLAIEALRARRNEHTQSARGGLEPHGDVYKLMRVAYPAVFAAMIGEATISGRSVARSILAGMVVFGIAKTLKWWAIVTLGPAWTFRVIVVPGDRMIASGPYKYLRHPNYAAVIGEFVGVALMTGSAVSGALGIVLFCVLLRRRIAVEERALASAARYPPCSL